MYRNAITHHYIKISSLLREIQHCRTSLSVSRCFFRSLSSSSSFASISIHFAIVVCCENIWKLICKSSWSLSLHLLSSCSSCFLISSFTLSPSIVLYCTSVCSPIWSSSPLRTLHFTVSFHCRCLGNLFIIYPSALVFLHNTLQFITFRRFFTQFKSHFFRVYDNFCTKKTYIQQR